MSNFENVKSTQLEAVAVAKDAVVKMLSNIGSIGAAPDFSNNVLRNPMQDANPLAVWLLNTAMSNQIRSTANRGLAPIRKNEVTGKWEILMPYTVGTLPPADTQGACCWVPLDIDVCSGKAPINMLCLKDCEDIIDSLVNQSRRAGGNDLIGFWQREGETVKAAKERMAKTTFAFLTALTLILGVSDTETGAVKPFHGLLEVMENPAVIEIAGANILGAFDALQCRLQVLGGGNFIIAVHPLTYMGIDSVVQPGKFDRLPSGWTRSGNELRFHGIRFIQDKAVPVDITTGLGEAWLIDGDTTGAYLATGLVVGDNFKREGFAHNDVPGQGCASECTYYYNLGSVFNNNSNKLARIVDIPLSSACLGNALQGLDNLVQPDTIVPM